ncbi:hypothetical protein V8C43DRAFT_316755 [Trichoderma afarasin]
MHFSRGRRLGRGQRASTSPGLRSLIELTADDYRVGWICPLEIEQTAAMEMLDEEHEPLKQSPTDHNVYKLGSIHGHNVKLRYGLLVGIGGGVPVETDKGIIRLGHVVVSKPTGEHSGAIQYDHGKAIDGFIERTGSLMPPPTAFLNAAQALAVEQSRADNDPIWENTQRIRSQRRGLRHFKFPGIANDHLYQPDYNHQQMGMTCEKGGCSPEKRIGRPVEEDDECFIVVHRGTIASGELVIKDAKKRDFLAQKYNLLCFETEAAGALTDFPCLVIRGISDYCDSHKNNNWHGFAAAAAAAYARRLFFHMSTELEEEIYVQPTAFDLQSYLPGIPQISKFIARKEELTEMQEALQPTARPHRRRTVVLHGLGGIGKTQLAIEYAQRYQEHYSTSIWLDARNETTINKGFADLAERILGKEQVTYIRIALDSQDQSIILKAVKRWLDEPANKSWLIIYDNYDDHDLSNVHAEDDDLLGSSSQNTLSMNSRCQGKEARPQAYDIRKYLPVADHGAVLITSRVLSMKLGRPIQISKLESLDDCLEILASTSGRDIINDPAAVDLAQRLDGLPLALASAGAYLRKAPISCTNYLQIYHEIPFDTIMGLLCDHGLAQAGTPTTAQFAESAGYSVHACVHSWMINVLNRVSDKDMARAALDCQRRLLGHADRCYELINTMLVEDEKPWLLQALACLYANQNRLSKAEALLKQLDKAEAMFKRALQGKEIAWGLDHTSTLETDICHDGPALMCLLNLGIVYKNRFQSDKAEALLNQALQGFKKVLGPEHPATLSATHCLGLFYVTIYRLTEAEAVLKQALQGFKKVSGPEHTLTLETAKSLGDIFRVLDRSDEAEAALDQAFLGFKKALGPEHMSTLMTARSLGINNIGRLYTKQGRFDQAEAMHERALQGFEKALGPRGIETHISMLDCLEWFGDVCYKQGKLQNAKQYYLRAQYGVRAVLGADCERVRRISEVLEEIGH